MKKLNLYIVTLVLIFTFSSSYAENARDSADLAVANILFDYDGSNEFASYKVSEDGSVDIIFARNMPDKMYSQLLNRLQNHPDINGVLAGKSGPTCSIF